MANETRVNLKHLLEDIRDTYTSPLEEVILTELVANALDGRATEINFYIDAEQKFLSCVDNGVGMKRLALKNYHNIAASTKTRGQGIGFAGVGAKLSLLIAEKVVTESRGGHGSQSATEWSMTGPYRAPWKYVPFMGTVTATRGTSVAIYFGDSQTRLLDGEFVEQTIIKHFYPLLSPDFYNRFLKYFYKTPISFLLNGRHILLPESGQEAYQHWFSVHLGKARQSAGVGFLVRTGDKMGWLQKMLNQSEAVSSLPSGLWISTFGKVIKGGWEWLGILPKNSRDLSGLVEIPGLSEILTTNKSDFLSDQNSLKKYYKFRKAVQEAVIPVLTELGENPVAADGREEKLIKPLNQSVTSALNFLVNDFPELESFLGGSRVLTKGKAQTGPLDKINTALLAKEGPEQAYGEAKSETIQSVPKEEKSHGEKTPVPQGIADSSRARNVKAKTSGLKLVLADITDEPELTLGRVIDDVLTINTAHPAWNKAKQRGQEEYHVLVTVAAVLSRFLDAEKNPQDFLNRLLVAWATEKEKEGQLF